jgi:hypothetical protein
MLLAGESSLRLLGAGGVGKGGRILAILMCG